MGLELKIALPPKTMFLRYPILTYLSHIAAGCGGILRIENEDRAVLRCDYKGDFYYMGVIEVLKRLLSGQNVGYSPDIPLQEARNKLQALKSGRNSRGLRCDDVDPYSLIECYLDNVVNTMSIDQYIKEFEKAFNRFDHGYSNDQEYGSYSPLSILVPESVEALRIFGGTTSRKTQISPSYAVLRERFKLGLHSLVAGVAGLWLGGVYRDIQRGVSRYILLASNEVKKDIVDDYIELVQYAKGKDLSDLAIKVLATLILSISGGRTVYVEVISTGYRCDLVRFDPMEIEELASFARRIDDDLRSHIVKAISMGGDAGEEIARRLYIAITVPSQRYNSLYILARKIFFGDEKRLTPIDLGNIVEAIEYGYTA